MSFSADIDAFFSDFAQTVTIDNTNVSALIQSYFDERDIERKSVLLASSVTITKASTVTIDGTEYNVANIATDLADPYIKTVILQ